MNEPIGFTLLSDEPNIEADDPMGFGRVAEKLAGTLLGSRRSTPFALGIEGGWGSGKSSLMRQLDEALRADAAVTSVWFNAWSAEGASALEGLIKTALEQLDRSVLRRVLHNRRLMGIVRFAALVVTSRLGGRSLVDATWDQLSVDARARNELRALVHEAVGQWRDKRGPQRGDRLLVIFIDDLDRASPTQVFEIFEAIKLYLDAPGFVFVVGYDNAVISEAVLEEKKYSHSVTGREYLEKIIQVGYRITSPDDDQAAALVDRFTRDSSTGALFNDAARRLVIDRNQRNPRRIKRFLNSFVLLYALDPEWQQLGPERLVEVLLLDTHFAEFMALFRAGSAADPVSEFLNYRDDRDTILQANRSTAADDLVRLQRTLPEQYPVLVDNAEFVGLVVSLRGTPQWDNICLKLQRRRRTLKTEFAPEAEQAQPSAKTARPVPSGTSLISVLWIGPSASTDEFDLLTEAITAIGARVETAADTATARRTLDVQAFGALIVDVEQADGSDAGFDHMAQLRDDGICQGPVVFFTSRLTPERRERANRLGATIANDAATLQDELQSIDLVGGVAHTSRTGEPPDPEVTEPFPTAGQRALLAAGQQVISYDGPQLTIVCTDRHGVFNRVTGVLAQHGLDVLEAAAATEEGMALEVFRVESSHGPAPSWSSVVEDLERAVDGRVALHDWLVERIRRFGRPRAPTTERIEAEVLIDQTASNDATVIEVHANDAVGALYRITRALADLNLDIVSARVQTHDHVIVDSFYLHDPAGRKITDPQALADIEVAIIQAIDESMTRRPGDGQS